MYSDKIKKIIEKRISLTKELEKSLNDNFIEIVKPFFDKWGYCVNKIGWTQYAPYFNDGEPCIFEVNSISGVFIVDKETYSEEYDSLDEYYEEECWFPSEGDLPVAGNREYGEKLSAKQLIERGEGKEYIKTVGSLEKLIQCNKDFNNMVETIELIPHNIMKNIFGSDSLVEITGAGIKISEYQHD